MKKAFFILTLAFLCCQTNTGIAQSTTPTAYSVYSYIKVAPGMHEDYLKLEKAYKKIHAAKKKAGKMNDWALMEVLSPSGANCEYNYVTRNSFLGDEQLAAYFEEDYMPANWESLLTAEELALVKRTNEIRTLVKNEIWSDVDAVMAENLSDHAISVFNYFLVPEGKTQTEHNKVEMDIWKPIMEARINDGKMLGWRLLRMESPFGSSMPYEQATIDIYKDMKSYLAPWFDVYFKKVHPGKNVTDLIKQTNAVSNLVKGELRMRIDHLD
jgi:hypothetical protein